MSDDSTGRRVHLRFPCELPVTLILGEREVPAMATNIGLGGVFLSVDRESFTYGTEATVRMNLPALKEPALVKVTVRWVVAEGVGLQFGSLRALEVWGLNQYFKGLSES